MSKLIGIEKESNVNLPLDVVAENTYIVGGVSMTVYDVLYENKVLRIVFNGEQFLYDGYDYFSTVLVRK